MVNYRRGIEGRPDQFPQNAPLSRAVVDTRLIRRVTAGGAALLYDNTPKCQTVTPHRVTLSSTPPAKRTPRQSALWPYVKPFKSPSHPITPPIIANICYNQSEAVCPRRGPHPPAKGSFCKTNSPAHEERPIPAGKR